MELRQKLESEVANTFWGDLLRSAVRGAVFLLADDVSIVDVGFAAARDDTATIQELITSGRIARPSEAQLEEWQKEFHRPFHCLIVAPWVFVKDGHLPELDAPPETD